MPSLLKCAGCGCLLAEWPDLPPHFYTQSRRRQPKSKLSGTFWYLTLYERLHGKCPDCKRELLSPKDFQEKVNISVSFR